jgi:hypothetical protein
VFAEKFKRHYSHKVVLKIKNTVARHEDLYSILSTKTIIIINNKNKSHVVALHTCNLTYPGNEAG